MKAAVLVVLGVVGALGGPEYWCAAPPRKGVPQYAATDGTQYRGGFRDFSLYITAQDANKQPPTGCKEFDRHVKGNDGLWVVEFDDAADLRQSLKKAKQLKVPVLFTQNLTYIASGAESFPEKMGYDSCGAELHKRVISVPDTAVLGPKPLAMWEKIKYNHLSRNKNHRVERILHHVRGESIAATISHLQSYTTRNSYSTTGLPEALEWLSEEFKKLGFTVTRHRFRDDMAPQVVAELTGRTHPEQIVVAGAHSDSRSTDRNSPTQRAPGADDNGSGTAMLLELAKSIVASRASFKHTIRLIAFTGEEQGLLGSRAIAKEYAQSGEKVIAMFNGDMLGYRRPNTDITLAFMSGYSDSDLTDIAKAITHTYLPDLKVGYTTACCSDQQSFYENGYASVGFFENTGTAGDYPHYHRSTDLLEYLDVTQLELESKALIASTLVFAEPL